MNRGMGLLTAMAAVMAVQGQAWAATVAATPATLKTVIAAAKPGDTVILGPGDYGNFSVNKKTWTPAITIDAHLASFTYIGLRTVTGVNISGGQVVGTGGVSHGIDLTDAHNVRVANMRVSGAHAGIAVGPSTNIELRNMQMTGLLSDGIDIGGAHGVLVDHISCSDFHPTPAIYANGQLVKDGDHPDCIQAWSRPGLLTQDITITNNTIDGDMQGISLFNHVRDGVDDGGFDRIVITGNSVRTTASDGITLVEGRNSIVRDNVVTTTPGSVYAVNGNIVKANLNVLQGSGNLVCGNKVPDVPKNTAIYACR